MEAPAPIPLETLLAHREWVRRVALALVRDENLAADLEQELWVKAIQDPPVVRGSIRGWLAATLRNTLVDGFRGESSRKRREKAVARPELQRSTDDVVAEADGLKRVVNAVMDLDEPYRSAVLLRYFEDLPPRGIAERQGVPVETVRTRLKRAIAMLRERFDAESRGDRRAWRLALLPLMGRPGAAGPTAAASGTAASAATGLALGGILMANKALASVAAVVVLAGAGWLAFRPASGPVPVAAPGTAGVMVSATPDARVAARKPPAPAAVGMDDGLPQPVDLSKCDRDLDLFGVVVDGADVPVPGAAVQVEVYPWQGLGQMNHDHYHDMVPGPSTRSASDGTFRLRLRRGETVSLRVGKEGLAERFLSHVLAGEKLRIVLERGADLAVTVLDAEGSAVPGTHLRLWRQTPSSVREIERTETTGADGRSLFEALPPGKAWLAADPPGRPLPNWVQADIRSGKVTALEVRLPVARVVEGTVTDAATGAPIAGARVGIGWTMEHTVTAGRDGAYRMETWAPKQGRPDLHARAEGYVGLGIEVPDEGRLDFALRPGDTVAGRLLDAAGRAVPGALVSIYPPDRKSAPPPGPEPFDYGVVLAGPDGRFRLQGLDHAVEFHALAATSEGHGRLVVEFPPPAAEGGTVDLGDLALPVSRALEGIVFDSSGRPAAGSGVFAKGGFPDRGKRMPGGGPVSLEADRGSLAFVRSDDLGRFRFTDLSPGPWVVGATVEGGPRLETSVVIPPDRDVLDVGLGGPGKAGATLLVRVVDEAGGPLEGIPILLMPEGARTIDRETDAAGTVAFQGLVATRMCHVQVWRKGPRMEGYVPPPMLSVRPEGQEIRFVLSEAAEVRGVVVDGKNGPLERMEVYAYLQGEQEGIRGSAVTDERGEFRLVGPRGKALRIVLTGRKVAPPDPKARSPVMPEPTPLRGEAANITAPVSGIRIVAAEPTKDRSLEFLVLDPDDRPLREMMVSLQGGPLREARTGADGRARMEGLGADRVLVMVLPGLRNPVPEDFVPPAGTWVVPEGQTLTLRFTRGEFVKGKVLLPDGSPAVDATVRCFEPVKAINSAPAKTDAAGRFRVAMPQGVRPHVSASLTGSDGIFLIGFAESVDPSAGEVEIRLHPKGR